MNSARAPGKIILSGEHSVVYGAPALVAAVNRYTTVRFSPIHRSRTIRTALKGISAGKTYRLKTLHRLREKLDRRFEQFSRGERAVQHILHRPDDLVIYSLASLFRHLPMPGVSTRHKLPVPGCLSSESELPLGAGMGSSAAAIAATLVLYETMLNHPLTARQRFEQVRFCERLQHGKGSAIDAAATVFGGLQRLQDGEPSTLTVQLDSHWYWLLHGIPTVSTGECVTHVRHCHGNDRYLWQQFAEVSTALEKALHTKTDPRPIIQENQRLLAFIGVTPAPAATLIQRIEQCGGAAKISGAGAHRGDGSGIILVYHPDKAALTEALTDYPDLLCRPLHIAPDGAKANKPTANECRE